MTKALDEFTVTVAKLSLERNRVATLEQSLPLGKPQPLKTKTSAKRWFFRCQI